MSYGIGHRISDTSGSNGSKGLKSKCLVKMEWGQKSLNVRYLVKIGKTMSAMWQMVPRGVLPRIK